MLCPTYPKWGQVGDVVGSWYQNFSPRGGDFVPCCENTPWNAIVYGEVHMCFEIINFPPFSSNNDAIFVFFIIFGTKSISFVHISIFYTKLPIDPLLYTRGNVWILNQGVAPRVSTLLINWCKTPIFPHPGPTWGRWGMTSIGAL